MSESTLVIDTPDGIEAYRLIATLRGLEMEVKLAAKHRVPPTALPTRGLALRSARHTLRQYRVQGGGACGLGTWRTRKQCLAGMRKLCQQLELIPKEGE